MIIHLEEVGLNYLPVELLGGCLLASLMAARLSESQVPAGADFDLASYSALTAPQSPDSLAPL